MPTVLRAFLLIKTSDSWSVTVHRDLESVLSEWKSRISPERSVGFLHVGFDRPPSKDFDDIASAYPGRLLVTGAAKFALPHGFGSSREKVGDVDVVPVFLGTRGWGYEVDEETEVPTLTKEPVNSFSGWLEYFAAEFPDEAKLLRKFGIYEDESYILREENLEDRLRVILGKFRIQFFLKNEDYNLCSLARAAPPWLSQRPLSTIDLSVRATNVFERMGINSVKDLGALTIGTLFETPNFGKKTAKDVLEALEIALSDGPAFEERKIAAAEKSRLFEAIQSSLQDRSERERDIVFRRMGLISPSETLQQIADGYNLTRERVRQLESKAVKLMVRTEYWDDLLALKLNQILDDRDYPIPVRGIEAIDPWFEGISERGDTLRYILENVCDVNVRVITIDGVDYFSSLDQEKWEKTVRDAKGILSAGVDKNWSRQHCQALVDGLIPENAKEFRAFLWEEAAKLCHFVLDESDQEVLTAYGRGAEQSILAVLMSSDRPLHFTELAEIATQTTGREIDVRRAHHAAAEVGLLLGRGTFGVDRHLPLTKDEMENLAEIAIEIVQTGPHGRQWHTNEILSIISEQGQFSEKVDKYILDVALQRSEALERLGRMVWANGHDVSARIDLKQAIVALLKDEGRPLKAKEIREKLTALRGVNEYFQIPAADPLIRIAPGVWGLNDRDISVKRLEQQDLIERVLVRIRQRGFGIHISEISELELPELNKISGETLFSLAVVDPRLKTDVSQHLFLTEWGKSRRLSMREAVESVLQRSNHKLSYDEIVERTQNQIRRVAPRQAISACLQSLDAVHDIETGMWVLPLERDDDDES